MTSHDEYQKNHCGLKQVYYTKTQARKAAREKKLKYANIQYFYQCEFCGWWHLSSSKARRKPYRIGREVIWR